jgi:putative lipoprotein
MSRASATLPVPLALLILSTADAAAAQSTDPWFGPDKARHFTLSALITSGGYGVSTFLTESIPVRVAFGASVGITAGAAKELFDLAGFGHPSFRDFAWDVFGTAVGVGISVAFDVALSRSEPAAVHCPLSSERESASVTRR